MFLKLAVVFCLLAVAVSKTTKPYLGFRLPSSHIEPRIVGGLPASPNEFPHQVTLQRGSGPFLSHFCGGSIINKYWVLTAAHCPLAVPGQTLHIKAGKHSLSAVEKSEQVIKVAKIFVHEKYPGNVAPYDISLLKLEKPLAFDETVQAVALPKQSVEVDGEVTLSGWGSTSPNGWGIPDTLRKAHLPVLDFNTCKRALEVLTGPSPLAVSNVCTGPLTGGVSACSGDSGGPLVKTVNGKSEIIGIVSWGIIPCGTAGAPSVYTKVSSYVEWIENIMANN